MSRTLSAVAWAAYMLLMGSLLAFRIHSDPKYCGAFPSFCRLAPSGHGFYPLCIAGALLSGACIDLLRDRFKGVEPCNFTKWQTIVSAFVQLLWLMAGFAGGVVAVGES